MTKKFVGAYINWFDNDLIQEIFTANSLEDAYIDWFSRKVYPVDGTFGTDSETLKEEAFSTDCMISVIEV